ncbi:MAG: 4Fe-4S binding protein [Clostridia bacterium]
MAIYKVTFSPTGGTLKVADCVAEAFEKDVVSIDLTDRGFAFAAVRFTSADLCVVAVPSYGGRAPELAMTRLRQLEGGGAKAIAIAVYGNRAYEDTLLELQDALTAGGFHCVAAIAAIAEHSILHQFATGRPNAVDAKELAAFAKTVWQRMQAGDIADACAVAGNKPYRSFGGVPMKPAATSACTHCGLCAAKCPAGAIPIDAPSKTNHATCISCMRCIAICPNAARKLNPLVLTIAAQKLKKSCGSARKNEFFV